MSENCQRCSFAEIVPKWRKRPRTSKWEEAGDIYECRRLPLFYLKLPTDWCGEFSPLNPMEAGRGD